MLAIWKCSWLSASITWMQPSLPYPQIWAAETSLVVATSWLLGFNTVDCFVASLVAVGGVVALTVVVPTLILSAVVVGRPQILLGVIVLIDLVNPWRRASTPPCIVRPLLAWIIVLAKLAFASLGETFSFVLTLGFSFSAVGLAFVSVCKLWAFAAIPFPFSCALPPLYVLHHRPCSCIQLTSMGSGCTAGNGSVVVATRYNLRGAV